MKWTERQNKAIETRGSNTLVSAAAGSGKTAVLVERIRKLIIGEKVDVDKMLVLTFTNAAASEMKEKIYKSLAEEGLNRQINLMGKSHIGTFHGFALDVIKQYYFLTGIDPGVSVCDETKAAILKEESVSELFEEFFESRDKDFLYFLDCYSGAADSSAAAEMIYRLYSFLESIPDAEAYQKEVLTCDAASAAEQYAGLAASYALSMLGDAEVIFASSAEMLKEHGLKKLYEKAMGDIDVVEGLKEALVSDPEKGLRLLSESIKYPTMRASKDEEDVYKGIKDEYGEIRDKAKKLVKKAAESFGGINISLLETEIKEMRPVLEIYFRLTERFREIYAAKKRAGKIVDFSDIEHMALDILSFEEAREALKKEFEFIFVDEFQDSNSVQYELVKRISRGDNLFFVGDVKQSIYKFRLAEPELFLSLYKAYKAEGTDGNVIDLNSNFRSKKEIIDFINGSFSRLMTEESCGIVYDGDAALIKGSPYEGPLSYPVKLYVTDSASETEDEEIAELKSAELEAVKAAEIIKGYIGKPVFDDKLGYERPLMYKDMVILMRSVKGSGEVFYKALSDVDIPVYLDRSEGYFDTIEIQVFLNLLRITDNRKQDIPLLSVLSCPLFGFTADELSEIRLVKRDTAFYNAFALYAEEGEGELKERCKAFLAMLDRYKKESALFPLDEFISRIILATGYGDYVYAQNAGRQRIANLRALIDKAESFERDNMTGLKGFISFVEMLMKRGVNVDIGQADIISESSDCVRIMTIHKSKGLEFPFVLIAGTAKEFRAGSRGGSFAFDKSGLCALKLVNPKTRAVSETAALKVLKYKAYKEEYAELIRVLYVAMTRAKDILVFSACTDASKTPVSFRNARSFYEMLRPLMDEGSVCVGNRDLLSVASSDFRMKRRAFEEELDSYTSEDEKTARLLCYNYFEEKSSSKRKYSVSELAELEREGTEPIRVSAGDDDETPLFIANSDHSLSAAERGTAYHAVMEHLPFEEDSILPDKVRECIKDLSRRHLLSDAQAKAVAPDKICAFFETDIGKRAMRAEKLCKEAPFVMKHEYKDSTVMVQGIIDCYFEEEDGLVLVDYKSNYVDPDDKTGSYEHLKEMYLPQLKLYREALEKMSGRVVKEAVLYLFSSGESLRIE